MFPILFSWRGIRVFSYPVFVYIGFTSGIVTANYICNIANLDSFRVCMAIAILTIPALIGSRLLCIATHRNTNKPYMGKMFSFRTGGASLLGGLPPAVAFSLPLLDWAGASFGTFWDVATFTILPAMVFGRIGCFLHGCCAGRVTNSRFGFQSPNSNKIWKRRFPTQLMEALFATLLLLFVSAAWNHRPFEGAIFFGCALTYSIKRILLQMLREDQERIGRINIQQALASAVAVLAFAGLITVWSKP